MKRFEIAHIKEQGVDLIIIPLHHSFKVMDLVEQTRLVRILQQSATAAGLRGTVIPVWDMGAARMGFLAPPPMHPFFLSIDLRYVEANINRQITVDSAPAHLVPARPVDLAA